MLLGTEKKYNTFLEDARQIIPPSPVRTLKVSAAVLAASIGFGLFFVGTGRLITLVLSHIF